jgi:hypothetical protein
MLTKKILPTNFLVDVTHLYYLEENNKPEIMRISVETCLVFQEETTKIYFFEFDKTRGEAFTKKLEFTIDSDWDSLNDSFDLNKKFDTFYEKNGRRIMFSEYKFALYPGSSIGIQNTPVIYLERVSSYYSLITKKMCDLFSIKKNNDYVNFYREYDDKTNMEFVIVNNKKHLCYFDDSYDSVKLLNFYQYLKRLIEN